MTTAPPSDTETVDLLVIGGGSAGVRAARLAAERGKRVTLAEARHLGGTCVNVGCIPKKLYRYAADYASAPADAAGYGWENTAGAGGWRLDWEALKHARAVEIERLRQAYARTLDSAGVQVIHGWARLLDAHTADIGGRMLRAHDIVLATGSVPSLPDLPGVEHGLTSDALFDLPAFPRHLLVVGGGYIACEMASIFLGLGAQVTLLQRGPHLLRGFDAEAARHLAQELRRQGLRVELQARPLRLTRTEDGLRHVHWQDAQGQAHETVADAVLLATGRKPAIPESLGLAAAGVALDARGRVMVDAHHATSHPAIHAVGDITTRQALTPIAIAEATVLVEHLYGVPDGRAPRRIDYALTPTAVFTRPAVGSVGYSEEEAVEKWQAIDVYRSDFVAMRHALPARKTRSLVKLVVARASGRVVGLHVVDDDAGEIIQGFAVAMTAGATKADFDNTTGLHPSVAEELVTLRAPARRHG